MGDGYCDSSCNSEACAWDGGDCLLTSLVDHKITENVLLAAEVEEGGNQTGIVWILLAIILLGCLIYLKAAQIKGSIEANTANETEYTALS